MKVWCEKCKGSGDKEYDWENGEVVKTCDVCSGDGYTENNDIDYQARVGRAALKIVGMYMFDDIDEMLRIAESEGE